ncbi:MAG: hypothetical protein M3004_01600 [Bacteroidota bacterium]|nr:hypothetical protein [Bacteroidota bacterium]
MLKLSEYNISEKSLKQSIAKGDIVNSGVYQKLIERKFFINEADIKRNILFNWNKHSVLPYDNSETGWQRFSLIEFVWLKIISQLRNFGLSLEKLKNLKTQIFNKEIDTYKQLFINSISAFDGEIANKDAVLQVFKKKNIDEKIWKQVLQELQISAFSILLLQVLIYNHNVCLVIDEKNECSFMALQDMENEKRKTNQEALNNLTNSSFIIINIRKILHDFFSNENINYDNEYLLGFLNKKEKEIIEKIRLGGIKQINITFNNDKPVQMNLTKVIAPEEAINKVSRILKKGEFQEIKLKHSDGKLSYYEQTDIIKL